MTTTSELQIGDKIEIGRVIYTVLETNEDEQEIKVRCERTKKAHSHTYESIDRMFAAGLAYKL